MIDLLGEDLGIGNLVNISSTLSPLGFAIVSVVLSLLRSLSLHILSELSPTSSESLVAVIGKLRPLVKYVMLGE